jgi:uncharacterized protein (AIM24 family)
VREARELLESVVTQKPDHGRAWGYLGLAFQRLGDFEKAAVALERAGHPKLAARLRASRSSEPPPAPPSLGAESLRELSARDAPGEWLDRTTPGPRSAAEEAPPASARGVTVAPGTDIAVPAHVARFAREAQVVFPEHPRIAIHRSGSALVGFDSAFALRPDAVVTLTAGGPLARRPAYRQRAGTGSSDELLGGAAHPIVWIDGAATVILVPPPGRRCLALVVGTSEPLFVREEYLLGFEASVEYVSGRLATGAEAAAIVKLGGEGCVVLATPEHVGTIGPDGSGRVHVRADRVVGWTGRMVPSPPEASSAEGVVVRGLLAFSGSGSVLVDTG